MRAEPANGGLGVAHRGPDGLRGGAEAPLPAAGERRAHRPVGRGQRPACLPVGHAVDHRDGYKPPCREVLAGGPHLVARCEAILSVLGVAAAVDRHLRMRCNHSHQPIPFRPAQRPVTKNSKGHAASWRQGQRTDLTYGRADSARKAAAGGGTKFSFSQKLGEDPERMAR
jgi:hypothetical protein